MAEKPEVLYSEAISEFKRYSNNHSQKQQLELNIINDPEFPLLIKDNDLTMWDFDRSFWDHNNLEGFVNNVIGVKDDDGIRLSRPATKAQLFEARNQLIRVLNRVVLNELRAKNVESLRNTLGSPYISNTVPELPENTVTEIQKFLTDKMPNTVSRGEKNKYKVMTNSILRQHKRTKINKNRSGRKNRKTRKMRR
jgi:hypothetical protein